ncbi:MAG: hypothetical protein MJA30_31455 [Cytophagales bacterium]|nr:hypothetical protein [Cytophagales bacterium]
MSVTKSIKILAFLLIFTSCSGNDQDASAEAATEHERVATLRYRDVTIEISEKLEENGLLELFFSETDGSRTASLIADFFVQPPMHLVSASGNKVFFLEGVDLHVFDIQNFSHQVISSPGVGAISIAALTEQDVLLIGYPGPWVLFNVTTGAESTLLGEVLQAYQADDKLILQTLNDQTFAFWPQEEVRVADFSSVQEIPLFIYGNENAFEVTE